MKEVKKTGHSKNNNNATKKKPVNKKFDNEAPRVTKIESPVKEARVVNLDNDFEEDDNDQKLIVVIAIALLVIIATVVGLLVGCERKEEDEPEEPNDDIVVPVEKDEDDDDDEKEEEPVKKTTTKVEEKEDEEESDVEVVIPMYDVTYYYGKKLERTHHESVYEGNSASEYVPQGYSTCKYYVDENYETEYSFDNLFEDSNIYLDCETIKYSVVYRFDENDTTSNELNKTEFTVEDNIKLEDLETTEIFMGWYLNNENNEYTNRVYELNRDLIKHADSNNVVYLYAKVAREAIIELFDEEGNEVISPIVLNKDTANEYQLPSTDNLNVCSTGGKFLGWTNVQGSNNVEYKNEAVLTIDSDYELYAVCGAATIQYESNGQTVTIAYTEDELNEDNLIYTCKKDIHQHDEACYKEELCENNSFRCVMPRVTKLVQFINSAANKFEKPKENEFNLLYINWSYSDFPSNGFLEAWSLLTNDKNGILTHPEIGISLPFDSPICSNAYEKITAVIVYTSSLDQLMFSDFRYSWQGSPDVGSRFRMFVLDKNLREKELAKKSRILYKITGMNPSVLEPDKWRVLVDYNWTKDTAMDIIVDDCKFGVDAVNIINNNAL